MAFFGACCNEELRREEVVMVRQISGSVMHGVCTAIKLAAAKGVTSRQKCSFLLLLEVTDYWELHFECSFLPS